jgi:hypothetical protein
MPLPNMFKSIGRNGGSSRQVVNNNGDPDPSEKHGSALYPELKELMQRNERWSKRVAMSDPG